MVLALHHLPFASWSRYITYSKEEEAVRCIQSVHGFVLDGKTLRACFGTTKYCHAWLRNVPCSNPDCLYLHEIGSQEDSFTKDEIISAYTRIQCSVQEYLHQIAALVDLLLFLLEPHVSRSQISAPPGFSVPSRAAPPGFTSHERTEQILDTVSGNQMLDASSLLRNHYHTPSGGNPISNGDIEFMDPAILAVGKGTLPVGINSTGVDFRSSYSPQLSTYGDARFQSFLQRSLPPHQNQRFTDLGDSFSPLSDAYGIPSRVMEQTLANNLPPFSQFTVPQSRNGITSNGQWDGWNEVQGGNNLGMAELLRTERLGFNKFYSGYEDSKIRMPSSGNIYNGNYGI
ncbi:CCR4-NOT transcription complex subunit [Sesamum angolense]|uniref:CCR4-NOT transcription complex subunit n=1 Tax=Sesamum angolense TaxID=2727404 RepID=A0AAE1XAX1_9LAMI|nr:CCR4-NOT transcription complex subunit [Sesamum angolense]